MKITMRHTLILLISTVVLISCASSKNTAVLESDGLTVAQIYENTMAAQSLDDLETLRGVSYAQHAASHVSVAGTDAPYQRLYNPDIFLYIYPHMATIDNAPIPGYSTVFPLYDKTHYAMPGEPVAQKNE